MPSDPHAEPGGNPPAPEPGPPGPPPAPDIRGQEPAWPGTPDRPGALDDPGAADGTEGPDDPGPAPDGTGWQFDPPDTTPHRLTARALASGISLRSIVYLIPALYVMSDDSAPRALIILVVLGLGALVVAIRLLTWLRFHWGFDGRVVRTTHGIVWHRERALDVKRIQQVEITQPLLHQVLGTAVLQVETASDNSGSEIQMNGIDADLAQDLRSAIIRARRRALDRPTGGAASGAAATDATTGTTSEQEGVGVAPAAAATPTAPEAPARVLLKPSFAELAKHALTGASLFTLPAVVAAVGQFLLEFVNEDIEQVGETATQVARGLQVGVVVLVLVTLVAGVAVAIAGTVLRFWNVQLARQGNDLRLTRGLTTRTTTTIPLHRLQVVTWSQNWVRRFFDAGSLTLRSAGRGGQPDPNNPQQSVQQAVVPWVTRADLQRVLPELLDRVVDADERVPLQVQAHPTAARRRLRWLWFRGLALGLPLLASAVAALVAARAWSLSPAEVAVLAGAWLAVTGLLAWLLGAAQYRRLGHDVDEDLLVVGRGVLGQTFDWMPLDRLQGVTAMANWFQRRLDVLSLRLKPAGRNDWVLVRDVGAQRGELLGRHLTAVAAGHAGPLATTGDTPNAPPTASSALPS